MFSSVISITLNLKWSQYSKYFSVPEPVIEEPVDPCRPDPCGRYAFCRNQNGYADCRCEPGYFGSPPNCRPECTINADCPSSKACIQQKCGDPCIGVCGTNAECYVKNHNAICKCLTGYIGDPFVSCKYFFVSRAT